MTSSDTNNNIKKSDIDSLIETLNDLDGITRQHARYALVKIGEPALDALIKAFEKKSNPMHWEVTKALSQIGTPKAAKALVSALDETQFSIRWIAAEGLIHIGSDALVPVLEALQKNSGSILRREASHHVIHDLVHGKLIDEKKCEYLLPVLGVLGRFAAATQTNLAATNALKALRANK